MQPEYWIALEEKLRKQRLSTFIRLTESEMLTELCRQHATEELDRLKRRLVKDDKSEPDSNRPHPRILLANHSLSLAAGTEHWVRDIASFLHRRGVPILVYSNRLGTVADQIATSGVRVTSSIEEVRQFAPQIVHLHHARQMRPLVESLQGGDQKIINMLHGVLPRLEVPQLSGVDQYLSVSIATKAHVCLLSGRSWEGVGIIPNFFDERRFVADGTTSKHKRALLFARIAERNQVSELQRLLHELGYELDWRGSQDGTTFREPEEELKRYDLVFASGRSAIEALACRGRVIVWQDGMIGPAVTPANLWSCVLGNFALFSSLVPSQSEDDHAAAEWLSQQLSLLGDEQAAAITHEVRTHLSLTNIGNLLLAVYDETLRHPPAEGADRDAELGRVRDSLDQCSRVIHRLRLRHDAHQSARARIKSQNRQLRAQLARSNSALKAMQSSYSWQLTRPLRALRAGLIGAANWCRALFDAR